MKERPIIFSGPMVRAILARRKTQTRRVITPRWAPELTVPRTVGEPPHWRIYTGAGGGMSLLGASLAEQEEFCRDIARVHRYRPGDRLWVRETWCPLERCDWVGSRREKNVNYRADASPDSEAIREEMGYRWHPSIFMPRWASRITLEITGVRVQQVQDISEADAVAEGLLPCGSFDLGVDLALSARKRYARLWDSLNAKRGYGWDENPWVWALTFRLVDAAQ